MGATNNMIRGTIFASIYVVTTILIPILLFDWVRNLDIPSLGSITLTQENYENIIFWVVAFGLIISGCAFFSYSSPKQSIRRGILALIQVIVNCLYIWSYKFSGATDIIFNFDYYGNLGFIVLNLQTMVLVYMGVYFLTIVLKIYDIFDFSINRKKIREKRMKA